MRWLIALFCWPLALSASDETVVLLHGLLATSGTMGHIEATLEDEGYRVVNIDYPTMDDSLEPLAAKLRPMIAEQTKDAEKVHVVTHSMGGILLRLIQRDEPLPNLGRVVMIAPPNHGTVAVNYLADLPGADATLGPAGRQLHAGDNELLDSLGPADFELGVIAGSLGLDPIMSTLIAGPDDGVVPVSSTKLEGMADHIVIHDAHPVLVFNADAMDQMLAFLATGAFDHNAVSPPKLPVRSKLTAAHKR